MYQRLLFANKLHRFNKLSSTNDWVKEKLDKDNSFDKQFVITNFQTVGRGQRNNFWESEKGKNLLLSTVCYPAFLSADKQFYLSMAVSLSLSDVLTDYVENVKIKWPNDIYIANKKVAGILIENTLKGYRIGQCIIGVGVNLNQDQFYSPAPNPTSVKQITGEPINIEQFAIKLGIALDYWYGVIENCLFDKIEKAYTAHMVNYLQPATYKIGERKFVGLIKGVNKIGQLLIEEENGKVHVCNFKEVVYLSFNS